MGCADADDVLKENLLFDYFKGVPLARWTRQAYFYDDNKNVLKMAKKLGIHSRDAVQLNSKLQKAI